MYYKLHLGLLQPLCARRRVHHEDDAVGAAGVAPPQRPQLVLPADVPHSERGAQPRADLKAELGLQPHSLRGLPNTTKVDYD